MIIDKKLLMSMPSSILLNDSIPSPSFFSTPSPVIRELKMNYFLIDALDLLIA